MPEIPYIQNSESAGILTQPYSLANWHEMFKASVHVDPSDSDNVLMDSTFKSCVAWTQSQGLPKSGFSSVGKLNFRDIFAGKKRTPLFTNTLKPQ